MESVTRPARDAVCPYSPTLNKRSAHKNGLSLRTFCKYMGYSDSVVMSDNGIAFLEAQSQPELDTSRRSRAANYAEARCAEDAARYAKVGVVR